MTYAIEQGDGYAVVHLTGDVDLSTSPAARKLILKALQQRQHVLVDLSAVTYIDSSGVANLVEGFQLSRRKGIDFGLLGVSSAALSVLKLARLDQVFRVYRSLDDWMGSAQPSQA